MCVFSLFSFSKRFVIFFGVDKSFSRLLRSSDSGLEDDKFAAPPRKGFEKGDLCVLLLRFFCLPPFDTTAILAALVGAA